jgi:hypothetical protein
VWRYHYPQNRYPYEDLLQENRRRTRTDPEYELLDTGIFADDRYWAVTVTWAKAAPEDLLWRIEVHNAGPEEANIEVLPTIWFRNTWSWDPGQPVPELARQGPRSLTASHPVLGDWVLSAAGDPELLFCDNDTNTAKLFGSPGPA